MSLSQCSHSDFQISGDLRLSCFDYRGSPWRLAQVPATGAYLCEARRPCRQVLLLHICLHRTAAVPWVCPLPVLVPRWGSSCWWCAVPAVLWCLCCEGTWARCSQAGPVQMLELKAETAPAEAAPSLALCSWIADAVLESRSQSIYSCAHNLMWWAWYYK